MAAAPGRASIRKDLAYAYLKIGENELARDQFGEAMKIDPADQQVALEYAFLCYETKQRQQARRVFDRIRKTGDATAEQAFRNLDAPLAS
jgi:Tfp pilus assembly protein PilF